MKKTLLVLIILINKFAFSQCEDQLLSGTFENIKYILKCPSYSYNHDSKNFKYLNHPFEKGNIVMVNDDYIKTDSIVKNVTLKDASTYFKEKLVLYSFEVVYNDSISNFKNIGPKKDLDNCKIKYAIFYYFQPIENVKYCIGYGYDENYKWIKEDRVSHLVAYDDEYGKIMEYPKYENVQAFEAISVCRLKDLGTKYLGTKVKGLELVFLKNSFYWKMNELKPESRGENMIKSVLINPSNLEEYIIKDAKVHIEF